LTKLCSTVYETGGEGERGGWTKEVMMVDGTVYMIDGPKTAGEEGGSSAHQTYYGHSYESLVTNPDGFQDVNTNTQWVAVVKANLNGNRIIIGGEVDCIDPLVFNQVHHQLSNPNPQHQSPPPIPIDHFVEVKTSVMPSSERDHWNLYRFKMLKFWLQSCQFSFFFHPLFVFSRRYIDSDMVSHNNNNRSIRCAKDSRGAARP
jgi:RAT1-interacting protein